MRARLGAKRSARDSGEVSGRIETMSSTRKNKVVSRSPGCANGSPLIADVNAAPRSAFRSVFATFPVDDLHEPQGEERAAIVAALICQQKKAAKPAAKPAEDAKAFVTRVDGELKKLKLMSPMSAEATVVRNYIDTLINLPWSKKTKIKHDLGFAATVLDEDHYGLKTVKERVLEFLASANAPRLAELGLKVGAGTLPPVATPAPGSTVSGAAQRQPDAVFCPSVQSGGPPTGVVVVPPPPAGFAVALQMNLPPPTSTMSTVTAAATIAPDSTGLTSYGSAGTPKVMRRKLPV